MPVERARLESLLRDSASLSLFLRAVQEDLNWVPREAMNLAAEHFQTTYMAVYEQVAFSPSFCLEERGRAVIAVCAGLACRDAGSPQLLDALEKVTGLRGGTTKDDGSLSLCRQGCFGLCAIGPNVRVKGRVFTGQDPAQAQALVDHAQA